MAHTGVTFVLYGQATIVEMEVYLLTYIIKFQNS